MPTKSEVSLQTWLCQRILLTISASPISWLFSRFPINLTAGVMKHFSINHSFIPNPVQNQLEDKTRSQSNDVRKAVRKYTLSVQQDELPYLYTQSRATVEYLSVHEIRKWPLWSRLECTMQLFSASRHSKCREDRETQNFELQIY